MLNMTQDEYNQILTQLDGIMRQNINEDADFNWDAESQAEIAERDSFYTDLLRHFVEITKERNKTKEKNKWIFFYIIIALLILLNVAILSVIIVMLVKCNAEQLIKAIPVFVTGIAGFATSIIAIPLAITKYLFNTTEDLYITNIINHTQEHDLSNKKIIKKIEQHDSKDSLQNPDRSA